MQQMRMKKGKLYRVNNYALSDEALYSDTNRELVRDCGYLWVWQGKKKPSLLDKSTIFYRLVSVATGDETEFLPEELEAADG